jgi:hypothetical protein
MHRQTLYMKYRFHSNSHMETSMKIVFIIKLIKTRFLMQCLYVDAYDSEINTALQRVVAVPLGRWVSYSSIRFDDPHWIRWFHYGIHTLCHLSGVHLLTPLWWPRNYEMHEQTIPRICVNISNHMQYLKYIISICNSLFSRI